MSLEEANIGRDNVSTKIWEIASIAFLQSRLAEEKTLGDFAASLSLPGVRS